MTHKSRKFLKFHVLKCGMFSFKGLKASSGDLGIGQLEFLIQNIFFCFFSSTVLSLVLCSHLTVMSCIDASVQIVTKSPKVGPLLTVYSPSL
jgi:hypothetical protein